MPTSDLTFIATIDDCDTPSAVLESAALGPFVAGRHRFSLNRQLERVRLDATLLPDGVEPDRVAVEDHVRILLAGGDDWQLCVRRWRSGGAPGTGTAGCRPRWGGRPSRGGPGPR